MSSAHDQEKRFVCEISGSMFAYKYTVARHVDQHNQTGTHKCNVCGQKFARKDSLSRHTITAHVNEVAKFVCSCGKDFSRNEHLQRHRTTCTFSLTRGQAKKLQVKRIDTQPMTRLEGKSKHRCTICKQVFIQKCNLTRHMSSVHANKRFSCDFCHKSWSRLGKLKSHSCSSPHLITTPTTSSNRMKVHRSIDKITPEVIKHTPNSKAKVAGWLIDHSPRTRSILEKRGTINTKAKQRHQQVCEATVGDLSEAMESLKSKRSKPAQRLKEKSAAVSIGPRVEKLRGVSTASKTLFLPKTTKKVRKHEIRKSIIKGKKAAMEDIIRKCRVEKLTEEQKKDVITHWTTIASHVSTDTTRGTVKKRIGYKKWLEHKRYIMSMTVREGYQMFKENHPQMEISESLYYKLKPFYVQPANTRDLELCCCQKCIIVRKAHRALMDFRKRTGSNKPIYSSVYDMVQASLCPKNADGNYNMSCLHMTCNKCGHLDFDPQELSEEGTILWQTLDYVEYKTASKCVKKLKLVIKETSPGVLVEHLKKHLFKKKYALHIFTAKWQREQWQALKETLPAQTMMLDMDFSENYSVVYQEEAQSLHFGKTQCTLHSCVVVRPTVPADMTNTSHVKEHWIMISNDLKHDADFVHHCLQNVIIPQLHAISSVMSQPFIKGLIIVHRSTRAGMQ